MDKPNFWYFDVEGEDPCVLCGGELWLTWDMEFGTIYDDWRCQNCYRLNALNSTQPSGKSLGYQDFYQKAGRDEGDFAP